MIERHIASLKLIAEDVVPVSKARLAAMILYKGKAVAYGFNQWKTHPFAAKYGRHEEAIFLHAETDAILKASKRLTETELKKTTLIICRVRQDAALQSCFGIAKPCAGCAKCIEEYGIKRVIYTLSSLPGIMKYDVEYRK